MSATHQFHIIYVSVNAVAAGRRARTRDSMASIRHVFLEADHDGDGVLARVHARPDLPSPSYVLRSSPGRVHLHTPEGLEAHVSQSYHNLIFTLECRVPEVLLTARAAMRPARKGARRAHTGSMQPTSNAAPRDAAPAECNRTSGTRY
jgi:hypothetical protein